MRGKFGRMLVVALVCSCVCGASLGAMAQGTNGVTTADAKAAKKMTVTGMAAAVANKGDATRKHLEVTDDNKIVYSLLGAAAAGDAVTKFDGKKVTATGTVRERSGRRIVYLGTLEEAK